MSTNIINEPGATDTASPTRSVEKDGKTSWQHWTCRGFFDANRKLCEIQAIGHDITAHQAGEMAIEQHNRSWQPCTRLPKPLLTTLDSEAFARSNPGCCH